MNVAFRAPRPTRFLAHARNDKLRRSSARRAALERNAKRIRPQRERQHPPHRATILRRRVAAKCGHRKILQSLANQIAQWAVDQLHVRCIEAHAIAALSHFARESSSREIAKDSLAIAIRD